MESDMHLSFGSHDQETKRIKTLSDHVDLLPQPTCDRVGSSDYDTIDLTD